MRACTLAVFGYSPVMQTKLSTLKEHAAAGRWQDAIRIAARFTDLGAHRNAILDAHTAYTNPRWVLGMRKDVEALKQAGIEALRARYSI